VLCYDCEGGHFYRICEDRFCTGFRYVVVQDGQFVLIRNEDEFRNIFAPVETADEALSYALAVTGLSAYYGLERQTGYEYFVEVVEDTHVDEMGSDGYRVHLFREEGDGWGLTYAVEFRVTLTGYVEQVGLVPVYNDPTDDVCCQD
jgi:hypothetical protein